MSEEQGKIWFPAKRYGWGWGPPVTWQGWVVLAAYMVLLFGGAYFLLPAIGVPAFLLYTTVLSAALIAVCWFKGEKPRWRWGE